MNKAESKYYHTAMAMDKALLSLLAEKDFEYITVKEICARAGVNRSTFYLHYETIGDLLAESIGCMLRELWAKYDTGVVDLQRIQNGSLEELLFITPGYLNPYLEFIRDNKKVFVAARSQPAVFQAEQIFERLFREVFDPVLERFQYPEKARKYLLSFYIHGMMGVIHEWIGGGCAEEIGVISSLLIRCIVPEGDRQALLNQPPQSACGEKEPADENP